MDENDYCSTNPIVYLYAFFILVGCVLFIGVLTMYFDLHKTTWSYLNYTRSGLCGEMLVQQDGNDDSGETFMHRVQYDELTSATDNWNRSRILGEGGFGIVYKGNWKHTDVAIKRLKSEVGFGWPAMVVRGTRQSFAKINHYRSIF